MHWGGGTPTYLDPRQITDLFTAIEERFQLAQNGEFSIEIDPRVTTLDHLRTLRSLGFNRLSVGIQDFDWNVQLTVRRIQSFERTREVFDQARELGFESINADLIYGLPKQTRA
jgi:oxygen-independent coproporphyrinogen-3 oxidase